MLTHDPSDVLAMSRERSRHLCAAASAERFRAASRTRRTLAVYLRRVADRLDPAPLAPTPAPR